MLTSQSGNYLNRKDRTINKFGPYFGLVFDHIKRKRIRSGSLNFMTIIFYSHYMEYVCDIFLFCMQNFLKLTSPKRFTAFENQKTDINSPQKTEASPSKTASPEKKQIGAYDSLILRRPTEKQFTFNINSFEKNKQNKLDNEQLDGAELRQSIDKDRQLKRNVIYANESYQQKEKEAQATTTAQSNNDLFSQIFLNSKQKQEQKKQSKPVQEIIKPEQNIQIIQDEEIINSWQDTADSESSTPKLKIDDFEIGKKLGAGKFGHVFLARHKGTGFFCALKKIQKAKVDSRLTVQLIREIKIQSFLNHPNIVKMYAYFFDETHIYLVMELCYSGQLYNYLKKWRRIPEDATRSIVLQICKALDYMHMHEIIHRDLKPENIIYQSGLVKICDFGWSISTSTMRGTFCGTPLYVSPQLLKRKSYDNKIDVWSVGILTYELLFGKVPFQIQTEQDYAKIVEDEIKFSKITKVSQQAKDFILNCLEKDPSDRYTVPQLIEHAFLTKQEAPPVLDMY